MDELKTLERVNILPSQSYRSRQQFIPCTELSGRMLSLSPSLFSTDGMAPRRALRLTSVVLVFLFLLAAGCGEESPQSPPSAEGEGDQAAADTAKVTVEDFEYSELEDGTRVFTGELYNPTSEDIGHAQIEVVLLDENNRQIDKVNLEVRDILAGERKSFEEPLDSDVDVQQARVRTVFVH